MSYPIQGTGSATALAIQTMLGRSVSQLPFWSENMATLTVPAVAADLTFPNVVVAGIPAGAVVTRAWADLKCRNLRDSSVGANQINAANKRLRIKIAAGVWGVDDIIAIDFTNTQWQTAASAKEGGDLFPGDNNLAAVVVGNGTYNFMSEETNRADAIVATAASLVLHDLQLCLFVAWLLA